MSTNTINGVVGDAFSGLGDQLWLLAPIGLGLVALTFGVPKGVALVKRLIK
jgi:hypothetical protein